MTFTIRLEQADGTPAEPPTMESTVTNWRVGETIPLRPDRTLRVVEPGRELRHTATSHPPWREWRDAPDTLPIAIGQGGRSLERARQTR
jgi:hypothetical protein